MVRVTRKDLTQKGYRVERLGVKRTEQQRDPTTYKKVGLEGASSDDWGSLDGGRNTRGAPGWIHLLEPSEQAYWKSTSSPVFKDGKSGIAYYIDKAPFDKKLFIKKRDQIARMIEEKYGELTDEGRWSRTPEIEKMEEALREFEGYYLRAFGEKIRRQPWSEDK